jgi:hypothetical protein
MLATALAAFSISLAIFPHETRAIAFLSSFPQLSPQAHEENQMRSLKSIGQKSFGVLSSLAIAAGTSAQDAVQWRVEDGGNGHWYAFTDSVSGLWPACRMQAEERGGHLAQVKSQATQQFVLNLAQSTGVVGDFWIGGFQQKNSVEPGGGWTWVDGSQFTFDAWGAVSAGTGSPPSPNDWPTPAPGDEDFLEICFRPAISPFGGWDDQGSLPNPSLIEWSADCNSDGLVDYGQIGAGELEDSNSNNIPDCCEQSTSCEPCAADIDGSGTVNAVDLAAVLTVWGTDGGKYPNADIDGNGEVNGPDLAAVLSSWGACP